MSEVAADSSPATLPAVSWHVSTASARGSVHTGDAPNQDAVASAVRFPTRDGSEGWAAAVSDGHGGRRYVRSDRGSRIAAELAVGLLVEGAGDEPLAAPASIVATAAAKLLPAWREAVLADVQREPFTADELIRSGAATLNSEPLIAYGATLLLLLSREGEIALGQLGDGDVLVRSASGGCRPIPADARLVGGETTSLCLPTAEHDFRFAQFSREQDVDLVLLATDGYANSFADERWWPVVISDLVRFVTEHGTDALDRELPVWLSESAVVGGDDVTVALLSRTPMSETAPTTAEADPPTDPPGDPVADPVADPLGQAPTLPMPAAATSAAAPAPDRSASQDGRSWRQRFRIPPRSGD